MQRTIAIALGLDEVFVSSTAAKIQYAEKMYGIDGLLPPIKRDVVVERDQKMTLPQFRKLQREVGSEWKWAKLMTPVSGVEQVVPRLWVMGCALWVVTSKTDEPGYPMLSTAKRWLRSQGLLDFLVDVKGAGYQQSKAPVIEELQPRPSVFMDDDLDKLLLVRGVVENLFLFSRLHNLNQELPPDIRRVDSWWHFRDVVCELSESRLVAVG